MEIKMTKKFYNDGVKTIKRDVDAGDIIPEGFTLGRTFNVNTWNKGLTAETDERYPFRCDFYIPSEDLFIEYNGTIEHNGRPYNPESLEDMKELEALIAKAEEKGCNSRYWNIIKWWTEVDPLKLKTLRMNSLNFRVIYPTLTIFK